MALTQVETSGLSGSGASSNSTSGNVFSQTGPFKNRIINGDMRIDQRNAGASVNLSTVVYPVDRWAAFEDTDGSMTAQRSSVAPSGFTNSVLVTTTSADTSLSAAQYARIWQNIEGLNLSDLAWGTASAKSITVGFWVRSSLTGTFGGSVANSAFDRSYPFTYSISAADTWEYKTATIPGDTSGTWLTTNGTGIQLNFGLGVGSTYSGTAGTWAGTGYVSATGATSVIGTNGATFYITGVQLEAGTSATQFERRSYGHELALCQRYYQKYTSVNGAIFRGHSSNTGATYYWMPFAVVMRSTPSMSVGSPTYVNASGAAWANIGQDGAEINLTVSSGGGYAFIPWTASIEL